MRFGPVLCWGCWEIGYGGRTATRSPDLLSCCRIAAWLQGRIVELSQKYDRAALLARVAEARVSEAQRGALSRVCSRSLLEESSLAERYHHHGWRYDSLSLRQCKRSRYGAGR